MKDTTWFTLPLVDQPLTSVTHLGNGKDADLTIELASGRRIELAVSRTRVQTDHGIVVEVSPHGDTMLEITHTGSNLQLRSGLIGFRADDERWRAEFLDDVRSWVASDCDELLYVVDVDLRLASTSQTSDATD